MLEETGYDLEKQLDPENVIEMHIKEQSISLYIVPGVPEDFPFKTRTRKEISVSIRLIVPEINYLIFTARKSHGSN